MSLDTGTDVDADDSPPKPGRRFRPARVVLVAVCLAMVAMWGYVVFLAFGPGRQPPVDRLDNPDFAQAAEPRCADAVAEVTELPSASESDTPEARADVVEEANAVFAAMLADLEELTDLAPPGDQQVRAQQWLDDWHTFLDDRAEYAEALRSDPEARMLVSEKEGTGRHVTIWIDEFANANRMPSCASPTDV